MQVKDTRGSNNECGWQVENMVVFDTASVHKEINSCKP